MTKLTDVAKYAGVSPTTVSRVLNNRGYISEKTKNKVHEAIEALNYHPNSIARSLGGKSTGLIGLIFYDTSHPFFGELISKLETGLFERGYKSILCNSANSPDKERRYLDMLAANKVDGIISGTHNLNIEEYKKVQAPIVSFDRNLASNIPVIGSDNFDGGKKATNYLIDSGAKNIHLINSHPSSNNPTDERTLAYLEVMKEHHLQTHEHSLSFTMAPNIKRTIIQQILQTEEIDGIFCTDDLTAVLVWETAKKMHLNNLKIVGYDGTDFIRNYFPMLTTIKQPINDISDLLIETLINEINGGLSKQEKNYQLPVDLIIGS